MSQVISPITSILKEASAISSIVKNAGALECKPECHTATGEHSTCSFFDQYAVVYLAFGIHDHEDIAGRRQPALPQVFPANPRLRSKTDGRSDLWEMFKALIHAYL